MELKKVRTEIDQLDQQLLHILSARRLLSQEVARLKMERDMEVVDAVREQELWSRLMELAKEYEIDEALVKTIWSAILKDSHVIQSGYIDEASKNSA